MDIEADCGAGARAQPPPCAVDTAGDADETAADLFGDPDHRSLQPRAAAVAFQAWHRHRNSHGEPADRDEPRGVAGSPTRNACADQGMPSDREDATDSTTVR